MALLIPDEGKEVMPKKVSLGNERTLRLDVYVAGEDRDLAKAQRRKVIDSIQLYRAVARKAFAALSMAEIAGAKIEFAANEPKDEPQTEAAPAEPTQYLRVTANDESRRIMEIAFGKAGKAFCYELRDFVLKELAPHWFSHVWDGLRRDIVTAWSSKDAEMTKATRGHLILGMRRNMAGFWFKGLPILRTDTVTSNVKYDGTKITLSWDHELGPVTFRPVMQSSKQNRKPKLDPARRYILHQIASGAWKSCTPRLSERDGILSLFIPYYAPALERTSELSKDRVMEITFSEQPEEYFQCRVHDGRRGYVDDLRNRTLSVVAVLDWLARLKSQSDKLDAHRRSCGNPRREGEGHCKAHELITGRLENVSRTRENGCRTWNHLWTKQLVKKAREWNCGKIVVFDLPSAVDKRQDVPQHMAAGLLGRPWGWFEFKSMLQYKSKYEGIELEFRATPPQAATLLAAGN